MFVQLHVSSSCKPEYQDPKAQRLQYPLIKEYSLNHSRIPNPYYPNPYYNLRNILYLRDIGVSGRSETPTSKARMPVTTLNFP